jgi:hypothetical protein
MDGSAGGRFSTRAICKEGSTFLQMLSAIAFVLRVSLVDANSPPPPPAPPRASQGQPTTGIPLAASSDSLGHLTSTSPALIIVVANVSFWPRLTGSGPEGTVGCNPTRGVT